MALEKIGKISLKNQGGLICTIRMTSLDENNEKHLSTEGSEAIAPGQMKTVDPGECGITDGTVISLYASVAWGKDNESKEYFLYEKSNPHTVSYHISGTLLD